MKINAFPVSLLLLLLAIAPYSDAARIQVTVDRNPVNLNDSFQIVFTAKEDPDDDPDFSPLAENFSILHQTQGSNSSWINGQSSKTIQWTLNVMAKSAGDLQVPAIHFGNDVTEPVAIQVVQDKSQTTADTNQELFLKVEATPAAPYLQSQVIYTMRVYTRVDIARAQLAEPELADAVVEKLGEDSNYNTDINGVGYSVTERKYAIFPQKSGKLTIKPLVLTAEVLTAGNSAYGNLFNSQTYKTKRIQSEAVTLDVKPAPVNTAHWLPAEHLELTQTWSGDVSQMKVGEPLTRTLTLQAKGITVGQLPELFSAKTDGTLKSYPDQPVLKENKSGNGLVAFREEKVAFIPSQAGEFKLPALDIAWFNTQTQKLETAHIPETILTAVGSANLPAPQPVAPAPSSQAAPTPAPAPVVLTDAAAANYWPWVALGLGLGWLATLGYFLTRKPAANTTPDDAELERELRLKDVVKRLKNACNANDAAAAKAALLAWGKMQFQTTSLGAVAEFCEARLRDEILLLNQVLYGKDAQDWQGKRLFQYFTENQARKKLAAKEDSSLKPLYRL